MKIVPERIKFEALRYWMNNRNTISIQSIASKFQISTSLLDKIISSYLNSSTESKTEFKISDEEKQLQQGIISENELLGKSSSTLLHIIKISI